MARNELTSVEDCDDFIRGCLFMGTGGGGRGEIGRAMLTSALEGGLRLRWTDVSDIEDDAWSCTAYSMGSIAPRTESMAQTVSALRLVDRLGPDAMGRAVQELATYVGKDITVVVPAELGGGNTPAPLATAMRLGMVCVDGDYAGRAIPEEMQGTPYLFGKNSYPLASVDVWGDIVVLKESANPFMLERIGKMLSIAAYGTCYLATTLLRGWEMKEIIVAGTLTKSLELGRAIRVARDARQDPVEAAIAETGGYLLFEGTVVDKEWTDRDGYMFGTTTLAGIGRFDGRTLRVWFKNENLVTWLDGEPWVCSPDLVVLADRQTGEGCTNAALDVGRDVSVVGIPGLHGFRSERGIAGAGPRNFGFDIEYRAIEELVDRVGVPHSRPERVG